jgi:tyrosine-protein kinase Etk/Wzc
MSEMHTLHTNEERAARWRETARPNGAGEELDAVQLLASVKEGRGFILNVAMLGFALVAAWTLASAMQFKAHGSLYLGELDGGRAATEAANELSLSSAERSDLTSETEILKSDLLVKRAVLESGLNVAIAPTGWQQPKYLEWLLAMRNPKLLDAAVPTISVVNAKLADSERSTRKYRAVFKTDTEYELWTVPKLVSRLLFHETPEHLGKGTLGVPASLGGAELTLGSGRTGAPHAGDSFEIKITPLDEVLDRVNRSLTLTFAKVPGAASPSGVVSLEMADTSPHRGALFLQQLIQAYLETRQSWKTEDATAGESFVSNQLATIRESLDRTEKKLADYRTNTKAVVLNDEARAMIEQIGKYEEQRISARLDVAAFTQMKSALKDGNAHMEAFLMGENSDSVLQNLATTLTKSREELAALEERFNPAAPELKQARAQVDTQLGVIRNYVTNRLNRAQQNLSTLSGVVHESEEKLRTVPGAELGLAQLARESDVYSKIYSYLLERQQQMAIIKASRVSKNRVLDTPEASYVEDSPNLLVRGAILVVIAFAAAAFVLLRRTFSGAFQTEADVLHTLGAVPILASVPRRPKPRRRSRLLGGLTSGFAEAFRLLRTNLYLVERPAPGHGKVVLVTSPSPGDGKTTVVFGLAESLAADKKSVLLLDTDLHKPSHHALIGSPQSPGLSEVLMGKQAWTAAIHTLASGVHCITAGVSTSSELLVNAQFSEVLREMRARYDFVLLDTPSFPLVSDPVILTPHADCVISVLRLKQTARRLALVHVDGLATRAQTHAIVVNDAGASASYGMALVPVGGTGRGSTPPMTANPVREHSFFTASTKSTS